MSATAGVLMWWAYIHSVRPRELHLALLCIGSCNNTGSSSGISLPQGNEIKNKPSVLTSARASSSSPLTSVTRRLVTDTHPACGDLSPSITSHCYRSQEDFTTSQGHHLHEGCQSLFLTAMASQNSARKTTEKAESPPAAEPFILKLPHPYLTAYAVTSVAPHGQALRYCMLLSAAHSKGNGIPPPTPLHSNDATFSDIAFLAEDAVPPPSDNSSWARARRSPCSTVSWAVERPSAAQFWLIAYALVSLHPLVENFRILLEGNDADSLFSELNFTGLLHRHPKGSDPSASHDGFLLHRSTFWQGAGCPFGSRPVWAPHLTSNNLPITTQYPAFPFQTAPTTQFPAVPRHTMHPVRQPKPAPGSIIYSRWIPHLKEHFTMVALDYENPAHLDLFHTWQNDPRVAAGWNETGTLEQHREYLRKLHEDPHVLTMFAAFEDKLFAYFEVYWAMVCCISDVPIRGQIC